MIRVLFFFALLLASVTARDIYVSPAGKDSNSGTPNHPLLTIDAAVSAATNNATIFLAAGHYALNDTIELTRPVWFSTTSGLPDVFIQSRHWDSAFFISSTTVGMTGLVLWTDRGDRGGSCLYAEDSTLILSEILIDSWSGYNGAALAAYDSSVKASNCVFAYNDGLEAGAVLLSGGSAEFEACTFTGNTASYQACALQVDGNATVSVARSSFIQNCFRLSDYDDSGPAISNSGFLTIAESSFVDHEYQVIKNDNILVVDRSEFTSNYALECTVIANDYSATVSNCTFASNDAYREGGAICNSDEMVILDSTFTSNTAKGSACIFNQGWMDIAGSTFSNNTAFNWQYDDYDHDYFSFTDGPIHNTHQMTIHNSSFVANNGGLGGAISSAGNLTVTDCTFTSNNGTFGGAISTTGILQVSGTTLELNNATFGGAIESSGEELLKVRNCTIRWNNATYGGAVSVGSNAQFTDCSLSNNWAHIDGAVALFDGEVRYSSTFRNCSFNCNCASLGGSSFVIEIGSHILFDSPIRTCPNIALIHQLGGFLTQVGGSVESSSCSADVSTTSATTQTPPSSAAISTAMTTTTTATTTTTTTPTTSTTTTTPTTTTTSTATTRKIQETDSNDAALLALLIISLLLLIAILAGIVILARWIHQNRKYELVNPVETEFKVLN